MNINAELKGGQLSLYSIGLKESHGHFKVISNSLLNVNPWMNP